MASDNISLPPNAAADENGPQLSKKRKRNSERARVTRACDRCKK
jgi:hypothetical protein